MCSIHQSVCVMTSLIPTSQSHFMNVCPSLTGLHRTSVAYNNMRQASACILWGLTRNQGGHRCCEGFPSLGGFPGLTGPHRTSVAYNNMRNSFKPDSASRGRAVFFFYRCSFAIVATRFEEENPNDTSLTVNLKQ